MWRSSRSTRILSGMIKLLTPTIKDSHATLWRKIISAVCNRWGNLTASFSRSVLSLITDMLLVDLSIATLTALFLCTHCLPPVAGSSTYLSKYNRTSLSRSSRPGSAKFTISSIRSFMAQSNCSGWLLASTNINLHKNTHTKTQESSSLIKGRK